MKVLEFPKVPDSFFEKMNYPIAGSTSDLVSITYKQADAYDIATSASYYLIEHGVDAVIQENKLSDMGIPEYAHDAVRKTWDEWKDHPYMIGRFDFAGGLDGVPIKMMEFNADTPFSIVETSAVQYAVAKYNGLNADEKQCNTIYDDLIEYFRNLIQNTENRLGRPVKILVSCADDAEDSLNTSILYEACLNCSEDRVQVDYCHWTDVAVDTDNYVCLVDGDIIVDRYDILVKMVPWDLLFSENEDMAKALCSSIMEDKVVVCNPPYAVVMQSKALYPVICQLVHEGKIDEDDLPEVLLETTAETPPSFSHVVKPIFGREGANIKIMEGFETVEQTDGFYENLPVIYQEKAELNFHNNMYYQAGCFVYATLKNVRISGLSFRRSESPIITTFSEVCGHIIED